jgi:hypothetical protein
MQHFYYAETWICFLICFAFDVHILHILQTVTDYAEYMLWCKNMLYVIVAANYAY